MNQGLFIVPAFVFGLSISALAASYTSDFSSLASGATLEGLDGWQQSETTYVEEGVSYPWAFGREIGSGSNTRPAAAVGGYYNTVPADAGAFYASHSLSFSRGMIFEMKLGIVDSEPFDVLGIPYGAERNIFRLGFYGGGAEIFSLVFNPNVDLEEPDAQINPNDTWNVSISSGGVQSTASMAIFESQIYDLRVSLLPSGSNLNYMFSLTGTTSLPGSGTLTGLGDSVIDEMRVGIHPEAGAYGTNHLVFDGIIAAVPEPSSSLLTISLLFPFVLYRRRPGSRHIH